MWGVVFTARVVLLSQFIIFVYARCKAFTFKVHTYFYVCKLILIMILCFHLQGREELPNDPLLSPSGLWRTAKKTATSARLLAAGATFPTFQATMQWFVLFLFGPFLARRSKLRLGTVPIQILCLKCRWWEATFESQQIVSRMIGIDTNHIQCKIRIPCAV